MLVWAAGCGTPTSFAALEGAGGTGARLTGLTLHEEHDERPTLSLSARAAEFQPSSRTATLHDLELRFDLPEQGVRGGVLKAKRGVLEQGAKRLVLEEKLSLRDAQGRTLDADRAVYLFEPRRLDVPGAARASSPQGTARAGKAVADLAAESLVLEGGVHAELVP